MGNVLLIFILFLSRVFCVSPLPIYFDSPEYVRLIENPSLLSALTSGHEPIHPGYILPAWIFSRAFPFLNTTYSAELISSLFGSLSLFIFYKTSKILFGQKIAIRALVIAALIPMFFLASVNVLTDTTYIFFYLLSFYCLLRSRNKFNKWFWVGVLSLAYSVFTHTQVILWLSLFLVPVILEKNDRFKVFKSVIMFLTFGSFLGTSLLVFLLILIGNTPIQGFTLLFMHGADIYGTGSIFYNLARFIRNFGIILLRNNSTLVVLAAILGSIILLRKDQKKLVILFLWFLPVILVTQYWHIGLFGRVALIASFPFAILASYVPRFIFFIVILQLAVMFFPIAFINKNALIQKELINIYKSIPENSVLISSNLIRPQVTYEGVVYFINEPGQTLEFIDSKITTSLKNNKHVYVDSQALYNPYYSYDGNHLHVLSLGRIGKSKIKSLLEKYSLSIAKTSQNPRIFLYKINPISKDKKNSSYVYSYLDGFENKIHKERIDYLDFGSWVWAILRNKKEPFLWML